MVAALLFLASLAVAVAVGRFFPYKDAVSGIQNDAVRRVLGHFTDGANWVCVAKPDVDVAVLERVKGHERLLVKSASSAGIRVRESVSLSCFARSPYSALTAGRWRFSELFAVKGLDNIVPESKGPGGVARRGGDSAD